jgi:hypothetical protein
MCIKFPDNESMIHYKHYCTLHCFFFLEYFNLKYRFSYLILCFYPLSFIVIYFLIHYSFKKVTFILVP